MNFPDTNIWLALVWGRRSHAEFARGWFQRAAQEQFFFCRFTHLSLLRLLTAESVMGPDVKTMTAAWQIYSQCCADERIAFLAEPEALDPRLRGFSCGPMPTWRRLRALWG